jgi:hypothetical protein
MRIVVRSAAMFVAASLIWLGSVVTASAHTSSKVGDLEMVVGFGTEPAYVNQPNSVQLILTHAGQPVTDLGDALIVDVKFGDASTELPLVPNFEVGEFGEPGDYRAWFIPSEAGKYTFQFTGTVDAEKVNESFTSGPDSFSEVEDTRDASFPPVEAPSNEELATKLDQVDQRTQASVAEAQAAAEAAANEAADSARTLAVIAVVVGAAGIVVGIAALALSRRRRA